MKKLNILLLEPDKILGGSTKSVLEVQGYNVLWCRSAQSALNTLDEILPDLIILELQLGVHNGVEFLYELRSYIEWQQIPVIVHTINSRVSGEIFSLALKQLNVRAILYKPLTSGAVLNKTIRQILPLSHNNAVAFEH